MREELVFPERREKRKRKNTFPMTARGCVGDEVDKTTDDSSSATLINCPKSWSLIDTNAPITQTLTQ